MNNLSIFIYLAEVCDRISHFAGFFAFILILGGGLAIGFFWAFHIIEKKSAVRLSLE